MMNIAVTYSATERGYLDWLDVLYWLRYGPRVFRDGECMPGER